MLYITVCMLHAEGTKLIAKYIRQRHITSQHNGCENMLSHQTTSVLAVKERYLPDPSPACSLVFYLTVTCYNDNKLTTYYKAHEMAFT